MRFHLALLLGLSNLGLSASPAQNLGSPLTTPATYQLQTGDAFQVLYRLTPEYNQTVSVQPDGTVTLQLLGSLPVRGLTLAEARSLVQQAAAKRLRNPELSLELKDYEKPHFTVLGEVTTPGRYELRGPLSVQDGVALAGGFKVSARHTKILLIDRVDDTTGETHLIDFKALEKPKPGMELRQLKAGDIIVVPTSKLSKVERYVKVVNTGIFYNPVVP